MVSEMALCGSEHFINDGIKVEVEYDYEGKTCFREVDTTKSNSGNDTETSVA